MAPQGGRQAEGCRRAKPPIVRGSGVETCVDLGHAIIHGHEGDGTIRSDKPAFFPVANDLADQFAVVLRLDVDPIRHAVPPPYTFIMGVYTPDLPLVLCHIFRLLASGEIHRYSGEFCRIFYGGMYTICRDLRIVLRRGWGGGQPVTPPCGVTFYNGILPLVLPFWTPKKEAKKVPLLRGSEPRPRGLRGCEQGPRLSAAKLGSEQCSPQRGE